MVAARNLLRWRLTAYTTLSDTSRLVDVLMGTYRDNVSSRAAS